MPQTRKTQAAVDVHGEEGLGPWLRSLRARADMTQDDLSQAAGVSKRNIQRWEAGQNAPGAYELLRLFSALGVTVSDTDGQPGAVNAELRNLADLLRSALAEGSMPSRRVERRLSEVADKVDRLAAAQARALEAVPEIFEQLDTLRGLLEQRANPETGRPRRRAK